MQISLSKQLGISTIATYTKMQTFDHLVKVLCLHDCSSCMHVIIMFAFWHKSGRWWDIWYPVFSWVTLNICSNANICISLCLNTHTYWSICGIHLCVYVHGTSSWNPSGGTSEQPVRKIKTPFKVGDLWGLSGKEKKKKKKKKTR